MSTHSIAAEEYARVVAKVYEPDLDWDKPAEYDLTDREEMTATAEKVLALLAWSGFIVQRLDDLALDEFDPSPSLEAVKAETTTEWGVRWTQVDPPAVTDRGADEVDIRRLVQAFPAVSEAVVREVTEWRPVETEGDANATA